MSWEEVALGDMDVFVDNVTANVSCGNWTELEDADLVPPAGPTAGTIITALILFVIAVVTVVGNALVLLAVGKHRSLQTLTNTFIVSLCVSDLLVGALVMPPAALNTLYGEWIFPQPFCPVWVSFDVMLCSASILNLCAISLDRFIQITNGLQHVTVMTRTRVAVLITLAWLLSILTSFPPINLGLHEHAGFPTLTNLTFLTVTPQCIFDPNKTFALTASIVTFYIPLTGILFTYGTIFREAKRQAGRVAALNVQRRNNGQNNRGKGFPTTNGITSLKAIRTLGIILGAFMITWLPFFIANVVRPFCSCVSGQVFEVLTWLGWVNSALNPVIYPLFMKDFKRVFKKHMPFRNRDGEISTRTLPEQRGNRQNSSTEYPVCTRTDFMSEQRLGPAAISGRVMSVIPLVTSPLRSSSAPPVCPGIDQLQQPRMAGTAGPLSINEAQHNI